MWDREDYLAEGYKQLSDTSTYTEVKKYNDKLLSQLTEKSNKFFKRLYNNKLISEKGLKYFSYNFKNASCLGKMYLLPKIHKRLHDVPRRPVISNCGTPTEKLSEFLDHHLQPVMKAGKSYIKDSGDFLEKLKTLGNIPPNAILVTADVVGLYPSIPYDAGLKALYEKLEERTEKKIPSVNLVEMADFVLKNNFFEFDTKIIQQISGTAIGTKFAPPYACLFMDRVENEFLDSELVKSWLWLRYIDDVFFIWTESEEKLEGFLNRLNDFHPNLKFTHEKSKSSVNFLDVSVSIVDNKIETDLYCKPTDCHQFLHFNSAHPFHNKKSIVYSQGLRIKRLCSSLVAFEKHLESLRSWFCKRGYPQKVVDEQLKKVSEITTHDLIGRSGKKETGVPLSVTYHPRFHNLNNIIRKHFIFLYAEEQVKSVFTPAPFVSFRSAYSLKNHLVRAKLYPLVREKGTFWCGKSRCETCCNVKQIDTFESFVTKNVYKINHSFNCDSKCLIYLLSCRVCGIQYVGSTVDRFRLRWNNYKSCQRDAASGGSPNQNYFHQHFLSEGHNGLEQDCEIIFIDKTDPSDPTRREYFWMRVLKTIAPLGLNIDEGYAY